MARQSGTHEIPDRIVKSISQSASLAHGIRARFEDAEPIGGRRTADDRFVTYDGAGHTGLGPLRYL